MPRSLTECARPLRRSSRRALALSLVSVAIVLAAPHAARAAQVWTASSAVKIRPLAPPPSPAEATAQLFAAKNEFESFQVVVTGPATGVRMSVDALSDRSGHSIGGRDVVLYREALLNVPAPTGGDGAAGLWPDALIPDVDPIVGEKRNAFPFDVPAGQSIAILVDIHVPADAPAGDYSGIIAVTGGVTAQVPFKLTVWNFGVPSTSTLRTAFGMTWNGPCMGHGDPNCTNYVYEQLLRKRYIQAALDNHISIDLPYYDSALRADGTGNFDNFDQASAAFLDGTAPTRLIGAKLTAVQISQAGPSTTTVVSAWSQHFRMKNWLPALFNYICDEPPMTCLWSDIAGRDAASISADPAIPRLVTTTAVQAAQQGATGISLFTPVVNFMERKPGGTPAGSQRSTYPATIFWYQSCMSFGCSGVGPGYDSAANSGWPTYAVDSDLTRNRAMEWLSFAYDVQGELYYETTMAFLKGDPWVNQTAFGGTGDGTLFYPGTTAKIGGQTEIPVESLRMKAIRDGMEDYELLHLASTLGMHDKALAIAQSVFPKTYLATSTPAALQSARGQLAALILQALAPAASPDAGVDGGLPATDGGVADAGSDAGSGGSPTTGADAGKVPIATSSFAGSALAGMPAGGCAGAGTELAWLALPLIGGLALRRRKQRADRKT
jgi:Domain of unknown function (DUF4091)